MSGTAVPPQAPATQVHTPRQRLAAFAVVIALGALAAFTLFGGRTTVPVTSPSKAAPVQTAPQGEPESGKERGD